MTTHHYRTCNLCEAMCGLDITLDDNHNILAIKGDPQDPLSHGHICPKALALQDVYHDPDRLKKPLRRTANGWQEIDWDTAIETVAANLKRIQTEHGRSAVACYLGNPNVHNLGSMLNLPTFIRALRTTNRFSATSVDQLPHHFASQYMFGHPFLIPIPDVTRTDYFLMLGANPLVSNGSLMSAGNISQRLKNLQKRGGKLVVIDPRRTQTANLADWHLFIRPSTDVLLLLGLLNHIITHNLTTTNHLTTHTNHLDKITPLVTPYTPDRVAPHTGITADQIRQLATEFAQADKAVAYGRIGLSTQPFGGLCQWLLNLLNLLTGNLDTDGGAMFTTPAIDVISLRGGQGARHGRWHSRLHQLPEFDGELPVSILAPEILTPGSGQIRALVTVAGNPVLSTPNGSQLDTALADLDFMVAIDIYLNETTRHADIILPPTTGLETDHYDIIFHQLAVHNTAKYSPPLFPPDEADDRLADWQLFRRLAQALATEERPFNTNDPFNTLPPRQLLNFALRTGPHKLSLADLEVAPHGLDLGALENGRFPDRLHTPDKRIEAAPQLFIDDLDRVETTFFTPAQPAATDTLDLIGRRQLRTNNSWLHNSHRLVKGPNRCTLFIHPDDAQSRHIEDGQPVTVTSAIGHITLPAVLTTDIMPGVVSIPHGWGHTPADMQMTIAQQHPGVSINDITDNNRLDTLTGNAALTGIPVTVTPTKE